jgi:hypothetical protein
MKIEINENNLIQLEEVFNGIKLKTNDDEYIDIVMRDSGFELNYMGMKFDLKNKDIIMKGDNYFTGEYKMFGVFDNHNILYSVYVNNLRAASDEVNRLNQMILLDDEYKKPFYIDYVTKNNLVDYKSDNNLEKNDFKNYSKNKLYEFIVKLLAKSMHYGNWKWETPNEKVMEMLMREVGLYPIDDEDEMIKKTEVNISLYQKATDYFNIKNK